MLVALSASCSNLPAVAEDLPRYPGEDRRSTGRLPGIEGSSRGDERSWRGLDEDNPGCMASFRRRSRDFHSSRSVMPSSVLSTNTLLRTVSGVGAGSPAEDWDRTIRLDTG